MLVGINLLREGLDLPEVSLVAILDADKEGFLRSKTSLIQTIGRAARNVSGEVHMYANDITASMAAAIEETERRREIQIAYNTVRGIDPQPLMKKIGDITDQLAREKADTDEMFGPKTDADDTVAINQVGAGPDELPILIRQLTDQMMQASNDLKFELAARLRDEIMELKRALREMTQLGR